MYYEVSLSLQFKCICVPNEMSEQVKEDVFPIQKYNRIEPLTPFLPRHSLLLKSSLTFLDIGYWI